jgi:hypothetical protein
LRSVESTHCRCTKHTNDSTNVQLDQPVDDNSNINSSREIENAPFEDAKINTSSNNKNRVHVAPIHVFEKPTSDNQPSTKKNALTSHSSPVEKPNPNPLKSKIIKQPTNSKDAGKNKKIPKAVMPSKTDY